MKKKKDIYGMPEVPFYADPAFQPKPRRRRAQSMGAWVRELKERELAEQLARPQAERVGKLKTLKTGDFSPEEIEAMLEMYGRGKR